ncbi:VanW family protein [Anoxynatronum buryatiense]|uniref:Vancomycin resistance protein YoaR, contains peptidoglycan-binding and VanW domains n=1 Tax=Anoxynatronum buryatiense TaxID=489973 RepID=A0AA45WSU6_9CLOT|nr:VanW family protein [Anoxynatronum buryatiense]SMP39133.1 Vancomycin resistance protein YoaR, contains peptidoglycan-binding and VanW domains [Anoxynatronum buryatiense]
MTQETSPKINIKKVILGIGLGILTGLILAGAATGVFVHRTLSQPTIYATVLIEGLPVHSLTSDEAKDQLEAHMASHIHESTLIFRYNHQEWEMPYTSLGFYYDYDQAVQEAMALGRRGTMLDRMTDIRRMREQPVRLLLDHSYEETQLRSFLEDIAQEIFIEQYPAEIRRENGTFIVSAEKQGLSLNLEETLQQAHQRMTHLEDAPVHLVVTEHSVYPTAADLRQIESVISEYSTTFNTGDAGRTANLRQGSGSIDGKLLLPGDVFSFNETTGPRIASAGYQEAPVILMGELVPGIGGGICQVSTTLYNAVVRADLQVVERTNHSLPVSYVPRGQDATVAFGSLDFRFANNEDSPIFVESEVRGNRLYVRIFGKSADRPDIELASQVVQVVEPSSETRYDNTLYEGETRVEREAKTGYRVVTHKIYRENGREIRREEISRDYYRPVNGIILQGTKPRPVNDWFFSEPEEPPGGQESQYQGG